MCALSSSFSPGVTLVTLRLFDAFQAVTVFFVVVEIFFLKRFHWSIDMSINFSFPRYQSEYLVRYFFIHLFFLSQNIISSKNDCKIKMSSHFPYYHCHYHHYRYHSVTLFGHLCAICKEVLMIRNNLFISYIFFSSN